MPACAPASPAPGGAAPARPCAYVNYASARARRALKFTPCATAWLDGRHVPLARARVPVTTHALQYGTSVFEGIRAYWNGKNLNVVRLAEHARRLLESASFYSMSPRHTAEEVAAAVLGVCARNRLRQSCYVRPFCFVGDHGINLDIAPGAPVHTAVYAFPASRLFPASGVRVGVSSWKKFSDASTPHMAKAGGNYLNAILATQEAHRNGHDEAIMLDSRGLVSEAPGENVFVVRRGELVTPTLASSALEGLTRDCVLRLASDAGMSARAGDIARSELYVADEIFLTGTAAEVTPVISVDGHRVGNGRPGKATRSLMRAYEDAVMGRDGAHAGWLTAVY